MSGPLLDISDVHVTFPVTEGALIARHIGDVHAVNGVSLSVAPGEVLGLVGESGCGKSTLARAVLGLVKTAQGRIAFDGHDLTAMTEEAKRPIRPQFQMIFQDPYASLNPRMTVFDALAEPILAHNLVPRDRVAKRVAELMDLVGLSGRLVRKYPHEFSGGQRQRIAIARALALSPKLVIADEPVSALDVSVQAQILNLIADLKAQTGLTLMLISHDLGVVKYLSHRIAVMYLGRIVEIGPADDIFSRPRHPYTQALLSAISIPDPDREHARPRVPLQGEPPSPMRPPKGCPFHPRCPYAEDICNRDVPPLVPAGENRLAACVRLDAVPDIAAVV
jgi:oligopeptide transport system ATP-binding protein